MAPVASTAVANIERSMFLFSIIDEPMYDPKDERHRNGESSSPRTFEVSQRQLSPCAGSGVLGFVDLSAFPNLAERTDHLEIRFANDEGRERVQSR
jgi:hypothetical protein